MKRLTYVVIGGGAAGFFGAIKCATNNPNDHVIILEKTRQILAKVRISGGGRCNVTHACFEPSSLIRYYPRGSKELLGPFSRFQPKDTVQWFEKRGVPIKAEEDGRMFPVSDSSESIINCLSNEARKVGVEIRLESGVQDIKKIEDRFIITLMNGEELVADRILCTTGSAPKLFPLLESLGHSIIPQVPSLFTFNVPDSPLLDLAGISVEPVQLKIPHISLEQTGPLLITHWGFSGPAVLKLSAWGAKSLYDLNYQTSFVVDWFPFFNEEVLRQKCIEHKAMEAKKQISSDCPFPLPKQLWKKFIQLSGIDSEQRWSTLSKQQLKALIILLKTQSFNIQGKTTYKQEFVTCGGVNLKEINFRTMQSKICPGLFFAGEILNIDGITGGFNFQNAWTTAWIAGESMGA